MSYAVELVVGAREVLAEMDDQRRAAVLQSLRTELLADDGTPSAEATQVNIKPDPVYYARPMTSGPVAVFRLMTWQELQWLAKTRDQPLEDNGVWVFDLLGTGAPGPFDWPGTLFG